MKKIKLQHPTERLLIFITVALICALISVLWFYGERLNILWAQNGNNLSADSSGNTPVPTDTRFYIQSALKSLYTNQAVIDPVQKRVYFPEASFYIPFNNMTRKIVYNYGPKDQYAPEQLMISTTSNVNFLPATWADVPCLQRHISILINSKQSPDGTFVTSKKLEDGRTLNIYKHQQGNCSDPFWPAIYSAPDIISALQQAHSY